MISPVALVGASLRAFRPRDELVGIVSLGLFGLLLAALLPQLAPDTLLRHLDQGRLHTGVGLLACAVVLLALGARLRAALAAGVGLLLLASVALFARGAGIEAAPERSADLSVLSFNVLGFNPRGDDVADAIIAAAPDVAVVLEVPALYRQLNRMEAAFPHTFGCDPGQRCDLAVFSAVPLAEAEVLPFDSIPGRLTRVRIEQPEGAVTLIAVHMTKPYYGRHHDTQLGQLAALLARTDGPVILVGDFNSQPFVRAFRSTLLEDAGLRLASGMAPTWPALDSALLSTLGFAIDHVLVRGGAVPVEVTLMADPVGSNHRGFLSHFDLDGR